MHFAKSKLTISKDENHFPWDQVSKKGRSYVGFAPIL